jgi:hypothetical protein
MTHMTSDNLAKHVPESTAFIHLYSRLNDHLIFVLQQVGPGINQVRPIITTSPLTTAFTSNRGIKRLSTGAISRTSL